TLTSPDAPPTHTHHLSLHDALPIYHCPELSKGERTEQREHAAHDPHDERDAQVTARLPQHGSGHRKDARADCGADHDEDEVAQRSEEHTSELQSPYDLVCRLLLEKK